MKPHLQFALLFGAVALATSHRASAQSDFPGWHNSLEKAAEIAAESKKPIFAVFRCVR